MGPLGIGWDVWAIALILIAGLFVMLAAIVAALWAIDAGLKKLNTQVFGEPKKARTYRPADDTKWVAYDYGDEAAEIALRTGIPFTADDGVIPDPNDIRALDIGGDDDE